RSFLAIRSQTPDDVAWFLRSQESHASCSSNNSGGPALASTVTPDLLPEEVRFFIGARREPSPGGTGHASFVVCRAALRAKRRSEGVAQQRVVRPHDDGNA